MQLNLYVYSAILLLEHLAFALSVSTLGPTYVDLKYLLNTSIQNISQIPIFICIGNILGTLSKHQAHCQHNVTILSNLVGIVFKYWSRQLIIVVLMVLMAVSSALMPFSTQLWHLYGCSFVFGIGTGVWSAAFYTWIIEIWQHRSSQVLFLAQFLYGLGFVVGPLLASPFVTGGVDTDRPINETLHTIVSVSERRSKLVVPFVISSGFQAVFPMLLLFMFVVKAYEKPEQKAEQTVEEKKERPPKAWLTSGIALMTLCLATINTLEIVYFNLGSTYLQYSPLRLSASTSASMISVMTAAYTVGQAINFLVAMAVRTQHIITYHFVLSFVSLSALFFAQTSPSGLWVVNFAVGLSISALFAGLMSYFERFIAITDRVSTFLWCSVGVVNFIPPAIFGIFIEQFPEIFIVIEISLLTVSLLSLLAFVSMKRYL